MSHLNPPMFGALKAAGNTAMTHLIAPILFVLFVGINSVPQLGRHLALVTRHPSSPPPPDNKVSLCTTSLQNVDMIQMKIASVSYLQCAELYNANFFFCQLVLHVAGLAQT